MFIRRGRRCNRISVFVDDLMYRSEDSPRSTPYARKRQYSSTAATTLRPRSAYTNSHYLGNEQSKTPIARASTPAGRIPQRQKALQWGQGLASDATPLRSSLRPRSAFPGKSPEPSPKVESESFLFRQSIIAHAAQHTRPTRPESAPGRDRKSTAQSDGCYRPPNSTASNSAIHRSSPSVEKTLANYLATLNLQSGSMDMATAQTSLATSERPVKTLLFSWGSNCQGQCDGKSTGEDIRDPVSCDDLIVQAEVISSSRYLSEKTVERIACGRYSTVVLCEGSKLACWGKTLGRQQSLVSQLKVPSALVTGKLRISSFSCGDEHVVALLEGGLVVGWGANDVGQLGPNHPSTAPSDMAVSLPCFMEAAERIVEVVCGARFTLAVSSYGEILGVGANESGQLGSGVMQAACRKASKMRLPSGFKLKQIVCGLSHSLVLSQKGEIWGCGKSGCLTAAPGEDTADLMTLTPQKLDLKLEQSIMSVNANGFWSCITLDQGGVAAWNSQSSELTILSCLQHKGATMRQACVAACGRVVAVSFACNVYTWEDPFTKEEPKVYNHFASQGAKVNFVAAGGEHFAAARLRRPSQPLLEFKEKPNVIIQPLVPSASESIAWGAGLGRGIASREACRGNEFQVQLKTASNGLFKPSAEDPLEYKVSLELWRDALCEREPIKADVRVRHLGQGRYVLSYGVAKAEDVWLAIKLGSEHIGKSPVKVTIEPSALHLGSCTARFCPDSCMVLVDERDVCGNILPPGQASRATTWSAKFFGMDKQDLLWEGPTDTAVPENLRGVSSIDVVHTSSQFVLKCACDSTASICKNPICLLSDEILSHYKPCLCEAVIVEGSPIVLKFNEALKLAGELRFCFEGSALPSARKSLVKGLMQLEIDSPDMLGTCIVHCEMVLHSEFSSRWYSAQESFATFDLSLIIVSKSTAQFAATSRLEASARIDAGFIFSTETEDLRTLLSKPERILFDANTDWLVQKASCEARDLCAYIPLDAVMVRAKILAGISCEWTRSTMGMLRSVEVSTNFAKAVMSSCESHHRLKLQAVLFKYLCDECWVPCAVHACGDCLIGIEKRPFSLSRPDQR